MANTNFAPAARKSGDSLPSYRAYLVRCWQERGNASDIDPIWRFSLEASWYDERRGFTSLQALMDHLQLELMNQETSPVEE
jgi:hypothetical protein